MEQELKRKIEAVLFSVGKKVSLEELSRLCRAESSKVKEALHELKKEYDEKQSSVMLVEEGDSWKLAVRENYLQIVKKVVKTTELPKGVMETLAVIAWKAPVLQSDVIKIRTNKGYNHIAEIEEAGFISKEKKGRTQLIRLTQKFMDYFDLGSEQEVKEKFRNIQETEAKREETGTTLELK